MSLLLKHYTWGMLGTRDRQSIAGSERVVAYTPDIETDTRLRIRKIVSTGLKASDLMDTDAYAFFPIGSQEYVACHYQRSPLSEPQSRGGHIFIHYIVIERDHLEQLDWNLVPIFDLFEPITIYSTVQVQPHLELVTSSTTGSNGIWLEVIRSKEAFVQAVVVRLLSADAKVEITSAPSRADLRWYCSCALMQCIPTQIRQSFSFCTLGDPMTASARVMFSEQASAAIQAIDWKTPNEIAGEGTTYAAWITQVARDRPRDFHGELTSLRLPRQSGTHRTLAARLDLAVQYRLWTRLLGPKDVLDRQSLVHLVTSVFNYDTILTDDELVEWVRTTIACAIILQQYDLGIQVIARYAYLLGQEKIAQRTARHLVGEVLEQRHIDYLIEFAHELDTAVRSKQNAVYDYFAEHLVFECLKRNLEQGLLLWQALPCQRWSKDPSRVERVLCILPSIGPNLVPRVIEIALAAASAKVFRELAHLLNRSGAALQRKYQKTLAWLQCFEEGEQVQCGHPLTLLAGSYEELTNPRWFLLGTQLALKELSPILMSPSFSKRCVSLLGSCLEPSIIDDLADVLTQNSVLIHSLAEDELIKLLNASIEARTSQLAVLCFVVLMQYRAGSKGSIVDLLCQYRDRILSMDAAQIVTQLVREYPPVEQLCLDDIGEWLRLSKELRSLVESDSLPALEEYTANHIRAVEEYANRRRFRDVEELAAILAMDGHRAHRNLVSLLLRLTYEIIQACDAQSWIQMSQHVALSEQLKTDYRRIVETVCRFLIVDDSNLPRFANARTELENSGCMWESGILVVALLQSFPTEDCFKNLAVPFLSTLLHVDQGGISLAEMGAWIDTPMWLDETEIIGVLCREVVDRDPEAAGKTAMACSSILENHANKERGSIREDSARTNFETLGAAVIETFADRLRQELARAHFSENHYAGR